MSKRFMINRRTALGGAAALATGTLAAGVAFPAAAQDNKKVIVGTWGGDYSRLLTKNIETPLLVPASGSACTPRRTPTRARPR